MDNDGRTKLIEQTVIFECVEPYYNYKKGDLLRCKIITRVAPLDNTFITLDNFNYFKEYFKLAEILEMKETAIQPGNANNWSSIYDYID